MKDFACLLKQRRLKNNWSQRRLAEAIGAAEQTVYRWEKGLAQPSLFYTEQLCAALEVNPEALGLGLDEYDQLEPGETASKPGPEEALFQEILALERLSGIKCWTLQIRAWRLYACARIAFQQKHFAEARRLCEESLALIMASKDVDKEVQAWLHSIADPAGHR